MPTYSYRCADCGYAFDIHQSFTDDALRECPRCGGTLRKQYGTVGVTFNGSGFYRTDSRADARGGSGAKAGGDAGGTGNGGAPSPSPTGSKTEAKASPASSGS